MALTKVSSDIILDGTIANVDLASDIAVTGGQIADNAVTLAKMAGLVRGSIILGDASGDPSAKAIGLATRVLTSDGTDADWAVPVVGDNIPYFSAHLDVAFTGMVDQTWTKLPIETVLFQTGSTYDNTTNYRWTPGVVGKYQMHCAARYKADSSGKLGVTAIGFYVNDSRVVQTAGDQPTEDSASTNGVECNAILSLDADDYVECWGYMGWYSGTSQVERYDRRCRFAGYKLID